MAAGLGAPPAIGAYGSIQDSRRFAGDDDDPGVDCKRVPLGGSTAMRRRSLHPWATAAAAVRLSHINPTYNHDLRRRSMKRACQIPNKRAKPRVLGYP